jgi:hypothetical protein
MVEINGDTLHFTQTMSLFEFLLMLTIIVRRSISPKFNFFGSFIDVTFGSNICFAQQGIF